MLMKYYENVAFQFYNKVEEVDYFLQAAIDNHAAYISKPAPRPAGHIAIAQHNFSAFISALYSTWEIAKLSNQLAEEIEGIELHLKGEWQLKGNMHAFRSFFEGANAQDFHLYQFLQQARHATNHDGSMALNGSIEDAFCFFGPIDRFEPQRLPQGQSRFQHITTFPPDMDALKVMRTLAIRLLPLFERKLKHPQDFSHPLLADQWKWRSHGVVHFVAKFSGVPD